MKHARSHNVGQEEGAYYCATYNNQKTECTYSNSKFVAAPKTIP